MNRLSKISTFLVLLGSLIAFQSIANTTFAQNASTNMNQTGANQSSANNQTSINQNIPTNQTNPTQSNTASNQSPAANEPPSNSVNNQPTSNISKGAVGNAKQLSQVLGNNSQVLANNTLIGNPNASLAGKVANATGNQTNQSNLSKNASGVGSTVLNKTLEVGKKIIGGAADVISNITGEIKKGVGAK
jgi:hypothetical protein